MNTFSLISKTNAYKIFNGDIKNGTLSHAYLIVCEDGEMLEDYVKIFVKTLMCSSHEFCDDCRTCRLIDKKAYVDVKFYPTDGKIKTADVDDIVSKTYVKPLESDKKVFALINAQDMNAQSQNKLLKTLEEPPNGSYIILAATSTFSLLPTVLSRVKRLDIPPFSENDVKEFLTGVFDDESKISSSAALSGGKLSEALKRYNSTENDEVENLCYDILFKVKSSKDAYLYAAKITKENVKDVVSYMQRVLRDAIAVKNGCYIGVDERNADKLKSVCAATTLGALTYTFEKISSLEKAMQFNANVNVVADAVLFGVLEGKFKWQKL